MKELFGWAGMAIADESYNRLEKHFVPFRLKAQSNKTAEYLWRYEKRLNKGKNIEPLLQETGDCTSFATAKAIKLQEAIQICEHGDNIAFKDAFPPYIYGVSRTAHGCGEGKLGRSAGSVGAWVVAGLQKYGVLFTDDAGVPKYSGALADQWGYRGVPDEFYKLASDNPMKSVSRIETVDELRAALLNKSPVIIGSSQGFKVSHGTGGCLIYTPSGTWGHEMVFTAWHDDPFPGAFRQNSWKYNVAGNGDIHPSNGDPEGGAWCRAEDLAREFRSGVEMYSFNHFEGEKSGHGLSFI